MIIVTAGGLKGYSGGNLSVPEISRFKTTRQTHVLSAYV